MVSNFQQESLLLAEVSSIAVFPSFCPMYLFFFFQTQTRSSLMASLVTQTVKNLTVRQETWVYPWVGKIPWKRAWRPTPVFLPGESPGMKEPGGLQSMGSKRVGHD